MQDKIESLYQQYPKVLEVFDTEQAAELTKEECAALIKIMELTNQLIQQGRYTDCIDELIFKVINAPTKRMKIEYV